MKKFGFYIIIISLISSSTGLIISGSEHPDLNGKIMIMHHNVLNNTMDIKDSHHDFSTAAWAGNEVCRPCHIPHNATTEISNSPLWNQKISSASYQPYNSPTMNSLPGQPEGKTKLCLSCHDGTIAVESHSAPGTGVFNLTFGVVGTNLTKQHPISFTYNSAVAQEDGELYDPSTTPSGLGNTIAEDLLDNGQMSCISCHDVHISRNNQGCMGCHFVNGYTTRTLSLWKTMDGSTLCFTCHNK